MSERKIKMNNKFRRTAAVFAAILKFNSLFGSSIERTVDSDFPTILPISVGPSPSSLKDLIL